MKLKVCLLGAFATGKTSLVRRRVHGVFSDEYFTTIGVRLEKLHLEVRNREVDLVIWDLHGEDRFQTVQGTYMRGAAGFLIVVDLTRPATLSVGRELEARARSTAGDVPIVWALNKADLVEARERVVSDLVPPGTRALFTSALTGEGVGAAFAALTEAILDWRHDRAR